MVDPARRRRLARPAGKSIARCGVVPTSKRDLFGSSRMSQTFRAHAKRRPSRLRRAHSRCGRHRRSSRYELAAAPACLLPLAVLWLGNRHQPAFIDLLMAVTLAVLDVFLFGCAMNRLVVFYLDEHKRVFPHSAFRGQTPDDMYRAVHTDILPFPRELSSLRRLSRIADRRGVRKG